MKALARNGKEIEIGKKYMFADIAGDRIYTVIEILDSEAVRIDDFYHSSRWACNALFEIEN
jgi:hypothetical protein